MHNIHISNNKDSDKHECVSHRDGDWIVFNCPKCPTYERRINSKTKEMKVKGSNYYSHYGNNFDDSSTQFPSLSKDLENNMNLN